jgi:serine/threonine-protein kinase
VGEKPPVPGDDPTDPERTDVFPSESGPNSADTGTMDVLLQSETASFVPLVPQPLKSIGRYTIIRELARGGMGIILLGHDPVLGRNVAIKLLLPAYRFKLRYRHRFLDEARLSSRLLHPGIVPVYDLGDDPDQLPYFVMRYVAGETLDTLLARRPNPTVDLPRFLHIFERVCETVAYAHNNGVIHRDLKPLNVMVAAFGVVKVMDWGVARYLGDDREAIPPEEMLPEESIKPSAETRLGNVVGTPTYMSPEQALGHPNSIDPRTDVFGLGGLLCMILTGQPPYPGQRLRQVYSRAVRADLREAYDRLDAVPVARELVSLAKRCLAPVAADRPRDAGEVLTLLTNFLQSDIRQAAHDLVRFFELSPDLFCIAGLDGYFRRVNSNFTRVLGYPPEELIARPWIEFVHPDDQPRTIAIAEQLARGLPISGFRNRYRAVHGGYRWFEWSAKPVLEEGILFAVARDITEQVDLENRFHGDSAGNTADG